MGDENNLSVNVGQDNIAERLAALTNTQALGSGEFSPTGAGDTTGIGGVKTSFGSKLSPYIQGFSALANAYLGYQSLQLGKKQFGLLESTTKKNLANQALLTNAEKNAQFAARERARLGSEGNEPALAANLARYQAATDVSGTLDT